MCVRAFLNGTQWTCKSLATPPCRQAPPLVRRTLTKCRPNACISRRGSIWLDGNVSHRNTAIERQPTHGSVVDSVPQCPTVQWYALNQQVSLANSYRNFLGYHVVGTLWICRFVLGVKPSSDRPNHDGSVTLSQRAAQGHQHPYVVHNPPRVATTYLQLSSVSPCRPHHL